MSSILESGLFLPGSGPVEVRNRQDLYSERVQRRLRQHVAARNQAYKFRCGCSTEEEPLFLIPFHEPLGKIGLRREHIDDPHSQSCIGNRDLERRDYLDIEDFQNPRRDAKGRCLPITRFGCIALRAASEAYTEVWSNAVQRERCGRVSPHALLMCLHHQLRDVLLPGGIQFGDFIEDAGLELAIGFVEQLPMSPVGLPAATRVLIPMVALGEGYRRHPLVVPQWLVDLTRRSMSIFKEVIPGPYLVAAVIRDGVAINLWAKPAYVGADNCGIMDSHGEAKFAAAQDAKGVTWFKPPTFDAIYQLYHECHFWEFSECDHRFDFAVFSGGWNVHIHETTSFDLQKHPEYRDLSARRLDHFRSLPAINGAKVEVSAHSSVGLPETQPLSVTLPILQQSAPSPQAVRSMLALLQGS